MLRAHWIICLCLVTGMVMAAGCSPGILDGETADEIDLFQSKLQQGSSLQEACKELDVLCKSTGFGCKAHALFCQVPDKQTICQKLAVSSKQTLHMASMFFSSKDIDVPYLSPSDV